MSLRVGAQKFQASLCGTVLVTGAAGFIGFHLCSALLAMGKKVIGVDALNDYYDPQLKKNRILQLEKKYPSLFLFKKAWIQDREAMNAIWSEAHPAITHVAHLAAQAGVRYSLENPYSYVDTNIMGQLVLLELARHSSTPVQNFVYASSSSVYGSNEKMPFSEEDRTDAPMALYAATKKCDELMTRAYSHLFRLPAVGLRYFSVYGPWGRPDMALFIFTRKILAGEPVPVFNHGAMRRDFTYVDDIVEGTLAALATPPPEDQGTDRHRIYNLGNSTLQPLADYIRHIEEGLGRKAILEYLPMQAGDIPAALSDISRARCELGFDPQTPIEEGVKKFLQWYKSYYLIRLDAE